jgi:hypothetical protein
LPVAGTGYYDFRFTHAPISAFEDAWTRQPHSTIIYRQFVAYLLDKGWRDVFEMYPVLARLTAQSVEQWIENSSRLCGRLAADRTVDKLFSLGGFPVVREDRALGSAQAWPIRCQLDVRGRAAVDTNRDPCGRKWSSTACWGGSIGG